MSLSIIYFIIFPSLSHTYTLTEGGEKERRKSILNPVISKDENEIKNNQNSYSSYSSRKGSLKEKIEFISKEKYAEIEKNNKEVVLSKFLSIFKSAIICC